MFLPLLFLQSTSIAATRIAQDVDALRWLATASGGGILLVSGFTVARLVRSLDKLTEKVDEVYDRMHAWHNETMVANASSTVAVSEIASKLYDVERRQSRIEQRCENQICRADE